jgi:hypothetical protein
VQGEVRRVVILYDHILLGEGLERLLRDGGELEVELVHVDRMETACSAVASNPDVVILERCAPVKAIDLLRLAPSALFIDVGLDAGPSWAYRRDELSPEPENILRTIFERVHTPSHPADTCRQDPVASQGGHPVEAAHSLD